MGVPVRSPLPRASRRGRGVGAISLAEVAAGGVEAETGAVVLMALDSLSKAREAAIAARAAQTVGDLSTVADQAEKERDAARASSLKWAGGAAATAGAIATSIATFGGPIGVAVGAVIGIVAGAALAAYAGYQRLADLLEHDADAQEYVRTATDYAAWFVSQGLPFPHWRREVFKNVQGYADALKRAANSIIGHAEHGFPELTDAVLRTGRDFIASRDSDLVVQAAYLTAGEHARQWPFERLISQALDVRGWGTVSDREALEILTAAIGTSTARAYELPAIYVQSIIDAARQGWNEGATRGINDGHFHPGILAMAHSKMAAEVAADAERTRIDTVTAAYPAAAIMIGQTAQRAAYESTAGVRSFVRSAFIPGAKASAEVPREAVDALKPRAPVTSPGPTIAIASAATVGVGWLLFKSAAGAVFRRALGF